MNIKALTRLTAASRTIEELVQSIHLMPHASIPKAFHKILKETPDRKLSEGFFYMDGTISVRYLELLKRHGIEPTHIAKGKEGFDFTVSYKVI